MILRTCDASEFICRMRNKTVVCWGAGQYIQRLSNTFASKEIEALFSCCVDIKPSECNPFIQIGDVRIPVYAPDFLINNLTTSTVILVTMSNATEVFDCIEKMPELCATEVYALSFISFLTYDKEIELRTTSELHIPKTIHYCWFGNGKMTDLNKRCVESWHKHCPDYEIIQWNESNYDYSKNSYMQEAYEKKRWGFVPDYARLDIVYEYGGIYLDTDVELIRSIDDLLYNKAYFGFQNDRRINPGLGFGAVAKSELIKGLRDYYSGLHFIDDKGNINLTVSPSFMKMAFESAGLKYDGKFQCNDNVTVYPFQFFSPVIIRLPDDAIITEQTYSIHWYEGSWVDEKERETKALKRRKIGDAFTLAMKNEAMLNEKNENKENVEA